MPIENTVPDPARYTLFHHGQGQMLDHVLITRNLLAHYRGSEIHKRLLHDESAAFAEDKKYPESDHAPVVATLIRLTPNSCHRSLAVLCRANSRQRTHRPALVSGRR